VTKMKTPGFRLWLAFSLLVAADGLRPNAAQGETRMTSNLTPEAVWDAISAAKDGDIVQLPEGTAVWTKGWNAGHWAKTVLSGRMYMSCGQAEQPFGRGLNFRLGSPRA
jgi:hypothetical protein